MILTDGIIVQPQKIDFPTPRKVIRNAFGQWVLKAKVLNKRLFGFLKAETWHRLIHNLSCKSFTSDQVKYLQHSKPAYRKSMILHYWLLFEYSQQGFLKARNQAKNCLSVRTTLSSWFEHFEDSFPIKKFSSKKLSSVKTSFSSADNI